MIFPGSNGFVAFVQKETLSSGDILSHSGHYIYRAVMKVSEIFINTYLLSLLIKNNLTSRSLRKTKVHRRAIEKE